MSERLERMRANPTTDWTIADVQAVCREHGILCESARGGGSHYKVAHPAVREILTIPFKRPIKPMYIRRIVRFVDAVKDAR